MLGRGMNNSAGDLTQRSRTEVEGPLDMYTLPNSQPCPSFPCLLPHLHPRKSHAMGERSRPSAQALDLVCLCGERPLTLGMIGDCLPCGALPAAPSRPHSQPLGPAAPGRSVHFMRARPGSSRSQGSNKQIAGQRRRQCERLSQGLITCSLSSPLAPLDAMA